MGMCLGIDIYQKDITKEMVERYMPSGCSKCFQVIQVTKNHSSIGYEGGYTMGVDIQNRLWMMAEKEASKLRPLFFVITDYEQPETYYVLKNGTETETNRIDFYRELSTNRLTDVQTWGLDR